MKVERTEVKQKTIEVVPAILRTSFEAIEKEWGMIVNASPYVQLDVIDGVFVGEGNFQDIARFAELGDNPKVELHMMVQPPADYVEQIMDLGPGRCVFHIEAFESDEALLFVYSKLREIPGIKLGVAINPNTPNERLEYLIDKIDYVLFMGVNPGSSGQPVEEVVFEKIKLFHTTHPNIPIAVDGHVGFDTAEKFVLAGATILCSNSAIFKGGDPVENMKQLKLVGEAALADLT